MDLRESQSRRGVRHPWERARLAFLQRVLEEHGRLGARRVLDVGSGDAWLATELARALPEGARFVCVDAEYRPDVVAALSLPKGFEARTALPEPAAPGFELVLALDVAEHVDDDLGFVTALRERIAPNGTLLFTVPAWPSLFSDHDRALGHHRRYTHATARSLLERAGFRVVDEGGFFHALVAPRAATLLVERLRGPRPVSLAPDTAFRLGEPAARGIAGVLALEGRLTRALGRIGVKLPGLSYFALAVPG